MSAIEQADKIVGIDIALGLGGILDQAAERDRQRFRRGAYVEWLSELKPENNPDGFDLPRSIEEMAKAVVKFHAATQPKGDGLPEVESITWEVSALPHFRLWLAGRLKEGDLERMSVYLNRCLSNPVRRLLAEFDITDERPNDRGVFALGRLNGEAVMSSAPHYARFPLAVDEVICWIVPKVVNP